MAQRLLPLVVFLLALLGACTPKPAPAPAPAKIEPGSKLLAPAATVATALDCAKKPLPFLVLEQNTLTPNPAKPGAELHHRLVYAFCPAASGRPETGTLIRSLRFKGKTVFSDTTKDFAVTPGRVAVDAFLTVPAEAEAGTYVYAVEYISNAEAKKRKIARTLALDGALDLVLQQ